MRDFIKEKGRELAEKVKEKVNEFIDNSPLQQEPIYLYAWELGHDIGIRGRGAIKYDNGVLTIINSDHELKQFQADFKSKEELIDTLSANGVSQINELKNTSNEREYMNLFSQLEQSRNIERERDLER